MTIEQDLKTVREALRLFDSVCESANHTDFDAVQPALAALDRIEARTLPDLPGGWFIENLYSESMGGAWFVGIENRISKQQITCDGYYPTPREAILNAIGKITAPTAAPPSQPSPVSEA